MVMNCARVLLYLVTLVLVQCHASLQDDPQLCPPILRELAEKTKCAGIQCISTLRQRDCPEGSVLEENAAVCGCCPGCVRYFKKLDEDPDINPGVPACIPGYDIEQYDPNCKAQICPIIRQCRRGLECKQDPTDSKFKCMLPPNPIPKPGEDCPGLCWLKQAVAEVFIWDWEWANACTADGYFKPIQCKGNKYAGDCFCVDKCGERIFGRARRDSPEAATQTCECSRRVHELRASGRISTLHCTEEGNYESLQCDTDSDLCYCMDPVTAKLTGEVLPEHEWKNLPCYNASAINFDDDGRYLRRCESEWAAAQKIGKEAKLHGLEYKHRSLTLNCDYDGSFGQVFVDVVDNRDFCSHKDGTQIGPYFRPLNTVVSMDCNCARDIAYYSVKGIEFSRTCDPRLTMGNYMPVYDDGIHAQCVDADGYRFGQLDRPDIPAELKCCLETVRDNSGAEVTTCPLELVALCGGILQCAQYPRLIRDHYVTSV